MEACGQPRPIGMRLTGMLVGDMRAMALMTRMRSTRGEVPASATDRRNGWR